MWDTKYRPLTFGDVLGQDGAVAVLKKRLKNGIALDTSYIFSGGHGQGKTTLARVLARAILCERLTTDQEPCNGCDNCQAVLSDSSLAFHERDAASHGKVADIRSIVDDLAYVVPGAAKQIHLFDEAHRISKEGQDVLLKPIEEKKLVGMFCTTEEAKIQGTIRSRCEEHRIRKITREHIAARMHKILKAERVEYEEDAVLTVIDCSKGHVRDIINRIEMISQAGPVTLESVREYLGLGLVSVYYDILLSLDNPSVAVSLIEEACDRVGAEEVALGVAESAMNSYRLAHKMHAEFAYVDRQKADALYKKYGNSVVAYARKFVGSPGVRTKVGLICDVVSLTTPSEIPSTIVHAIPQIPVAIPIPAQVHSVNPALALPVPAPQVAVPLPPAPIAPVNGKIGNVGEDPLALTTIDKLGVPKDHPRGHEDGDKKVVPAVKEEKALPPNDWRRAFERDWRT